MLPVQQNRSIDPYIAGYPKARVRLRVKVMPINGTNICGQHWPHGESEQEVYEDHLPAVRKRTQTAEDKETWASANRLHAQHLATWQKQNGGKSADVYGGSPSAEFYRLTLRGLPPVVEFEQLEHIPAPPTAAEMASVERKQLADLIASAIVASREPSSVSSSEKRR